MKYSWEAHSRVDESIYGEAETLEAAKADAIKAANKLVSGRATVEEMPGDRFWSWEYDDNGDDIADGWRERTE